MKLPLESRQNFRILFYNSKIPTRRVKENLNRYGFNEITFVEDADALVNTVNGLNPKAVIFNHHAENTFHTPVLLDTLRKSSSVPVIIWSDELTEQTSRKFLSYKNTYILRLSDGFVSLTEILQRIELKTKNPALWV